MSGDEEKSETRFRPGWVTLGGRVGAPGVGVPNQTETNQALPRIDTPPPPRPQPPPPRPQPPPPRPPVPPDPGFGVRPPPPRVPAGPPGAVLERMALNFEQVSGSRHGLGPVLPFLLFALRIRNVPFVPNPAELRTRVEAAIRKGVGELRQNGWDPRHLDIVRYFVSCAIDESVQSTPWGSQWAEKPLVSAFAQNAEGGERFFNQIDHILQDPDAYDIKIAETAYVCLLVGLRGRYAMQAGGEVRVAEYRERLLELIRQRGNASIEALFGLAKPVVEVPQDVPRLSALWVPAVVALLLVGLSYVGFRWWLDAASAPLLAEIATRSAEEVRLPNQRYTAIATPPPPALPADPFAPIRRLAAEMGWTFSEDATSFRLGMVGRGSFASASASLSPDVAAVVRQIGSEARTIGVTLLVRGHTDLVPIRSFEFRNNFELSRARAASVALALQPGYGVEPAAEGIGELEPLCREPTADCHAQNRRVEITGRLEN